MNSAARADKNLSRVLGLLLALLSIGAPATASAEQFSTYIDETVLVYKAEDVIHRRLPLRMSVRNSTSVHAHTVTLACMGVKMSSGELIAFLPGSKSCIPLSGLSSYKIRLKLGEASTDGFERDQLKFREQLRSSPVVVMQPLRIPVSQGLACECPPDPKPEDIFEDGFETIF